MRISTSENQLPSIMDLGSAGKKTPSIVGIAESSPYPNNSNWATKSFSISMVLRHFIMFMVVLLTSDGPHPTLLMNELALFLDFSAVMKPQGAFMVPLCKMARRTKCRLMGDSRWDEMDAAPAEWPNSVKEFGSPPKDWMLFLIHSMANIWSYIAMLPGASSLPK